MATISNIPYADIEVGQTATYSKQVTAQDITLFAHVSGDLNPVHLDAEFAATTSFGEPIAHGMLTGALISAALATELPGPGGIYLGQTLRFTAPVKVNDILTVTLSVTAKKERLRRVTLDCQVTNQTGDVVAKGEAQVMASAQYLELEQPALPEVQVTARAG